MKKLTLNMETVRKLDEDVMEKVKGGKGNLAATTRGPVCAMLTKCPNIAC